MVGRQDAILEVVKDIRDINTGKNIKLPSNENTEEDMKWCYFCKKQFPVNKLKFFNDQPICSKCWDDNRLSD